MTLATRINSEHLIDFASAVYETQGMPQKDARLIADTLVQADLWGHQSHGVLRLGWYLDRLRNGVMKSQTEPEFVGQSSGRDRHHPVIKTAGLISIEGQK